ncbi:MAG TPA: T9SS type A sorting domain-containing protein [Parafilimonas sp.]|jgi:hypothetical protein
MHVHFNSADAKQIVIIDLYGNQKLRTSVNGNNQTISMQNINAGTFIIQVLNFKGEKIATTTLIKE